MGFDATLGFVVNMGAPAVAGRLLPAGRPRRPRHRRGAPWCCCPRSRTATSGPTSPRWPSRARSWSRQTLAGAGRRGPSRRHARARDARRAQPHPARDDAQGARRRRRGPPGARRLGGHRPAVVLRRGALRPGPRGPRARAAARCSTTSTPTACRMRFLREQLDDPEAADCGRCDNCGGLTVDATVSAEAVEEAGAAAGPARRADRAAQDVADRAGQPRHRPQGQDRASPPSEGRAVARLTDLGHGQALRALFRAGHPRRPGAGAAGPGRRSTCSTTGAPRSTRSWWSSRRPGRP